jgi:hypothetical protein
MFTRSDSGILTILSTVFRRAAKDAPRVVPVKVDEDFQTRSSGLLVRPLFSASRLLFPEKEAKSVVLLRRSSCYPTLGEADPGGLGACPQQNTY